MTRSVALLLLLLLIAPIVVLLPFLPYPNSLTVLNETNKEMLGLLYSWTDAERIDDVKKDLTSTGEARRLLLRDYDDTATKYRYYIQ